MSLKLNFTVAGVHCYFKNVELQQVSHKSTIAEIMDAVQKEFPAFQYYAGEGIVDTISYDFSEDSSAEGDQPANGRRLASNLIDPSGGASYVWQYARAVEGTFPNSTNPYQIHIPSPEQNAIGSQKLQFLAGNREFIIPPEDRTGFKLLSWSLTWRLVRVPLESEAAHKYLRAKSEALRQMLA